MNENLVKSVSAQVSYFNYDRLKEIAAEKRLPISRLIGHLVDKELSATKEPFSYFPEFPKNMENSDFSEEASIILENMRKKKMSFGFDLLHLLRTDLGVSDSFIFSYAFAELLNKGFLKPVKPGKLGKERNPEGYVYYKPVNNLLSDKNERHKLYQELKKEFGE